MYLNFGVIADAIGITLFEKRKSIIERQNFVKEFKQIKDLRKIIVYDLNPREKWYESIVEFYYQDDDSLDFYLDFSEDEFEMALYNKMMYQLLHGYHEAISKDIPKKLEIKIPRPKRI